jgi:hypothetical protein
MGQNLGARRQKCKVFEPMDAITLHLFGKKKVQNPYLAYFPFFFSKP